MFSKILYYIFPLFLIFKESLYINPKFYHGIGIHFITISTENDQLFHCKNVCVFFFVCTYVCVCVFIVCAIIVH